MKNYLLILLAFVFTGCASEIYQYVPVKDKTANSTESSKNKSEKIAIFFDGTNNIPSDNTNVYRLFNMVKDQDLQSTRLMYIEGVGTEWYRKVSGAILGNGINQRLEESYKYLIKHYNDNNDELYLFGFSRGAYNARILAGLLYIAGLPDVSSLDDNEQEKLVSNIVKVYKMDLSFDKKQKRIKSIPNYRISKVEPRVKFMGVWDTVSSIGPQSYNASYKGKEPLKYLDQICNIDKVAHALSTDNREKKFTPELMTRPGLIFHCGLGYETDSSEAGAFIKKKVDEVWFYGAHSDIGGGYASEQGNEKPLSGVSLNWMLRKLSKVDDSILLTKKEVGEDKNGTAHIGEDSIADGYMYTNWNRDIPKYMKEIVHPDLNIPVLHSSVLARLNQVPRTCREFDWIGDLTACNRDPNSKFCKVLGWLGDRTGCPDPKKEYSTNFRGCFKKDDLIDLELKNDPTKVDYTLKYAPKKGEKCFYIDEKERYDF